MVRAKNVRFWMNASKAEVRASLGGTDEEWEIFAVIFPSPPPWLLFLPPLPLTTAQLTQQFQDAAYAEYDSRPDFFDPALAWSSLDLHERSLSITRLQARCVRMKIKWGPSAAEWKLHNLHQSAIKSRKKYLVRRKGNSWWRNHKKIKTSYVIVKPSNSVVYSGRKRGPRRPRGVMYDPVRDALMSNTTAAAAEEDERQRGGGGDPMVLCETGGGTIVEGDVVVALSSGQGAQHLQQTG